MEGPRHRRPGGQDGLSGLRMVAEDDAAAAASPRLRAPTPLIERRSEHGLGTLRKALRAAPSPARPGSRGMEALPQAARDRFELSDIELRAHGTRESLLHSGSDFGDFRGFVNLGLLFLFVSSFRIAAENIRDHGILADINPFLRCLWPLPITPNRLIFTSLFGYVLTALVIEKAAAYLAVSTSVPGKAQFRRVAAELALDGAHWINITASLLVPCALITYYRTPIAGAFLVVFQAMIIWMKLISYVAVNQHYRWRMAQPHGEPTRDRSGSGGAGGSSLDASAVDGTRPESTGGVVWEDDADAKSRPESPAVKYPENVTFRDMLYFIFVPTLCYEIDMPRASRIRWRFAMRRFIEVVVLLLTVVFLMQQWMYPLIRVTLELGDDAEYIYLFFRVLKMALPNNLIWLILFYLYFHSWMNLWAELLRFGDRQFYRDWWNAHTVYYFWRNWNIPVHKWMQRHVYRPLRAVGASRIAAVTFVFALSAILHEVLVDIPLGVFKGYAFAGMFIYVPLAVVTDLLYKYTKSKTWGNVVVWCSLVLGQPAGILLYAKGWSAIAGPRAGNVTSIQSDDRPRW